VRNWFVFYRRKEDNRRRHLKLGAYPGVSLAQARELAEIELGKIATGEDPQAEREAARERSGAETVAALAERYLEEYAKVHKRPKGYTMDRWQLDTYVLPRWGERPIDEITKQDVRGFVQDLADGKLAAKGKPTKVAPRNLRAVLSKMFDWAAEQGLLPGNPAAGVKLPTRVREHQKKGGRDRVLSDEEISVLWGELDRLEEVAVARKHPPVSAAAIRLILLTAQRPGGGLLHAVARHRGQRVVGGPGRGGEERRIESCPAIPASAEDSGRAPAQDRQGIVGPPEPVQARRPPDEPQDRERHHRAEVRDAPLDTPRPTADGRFQDAGDWHRPAGPPGDPQSQGPERHRRL
jgi:hypothetical protein